jgi:hypothetical protein
MKQNLKAYYKPKLTNHGRIVKLTQGGSGMMSESASLQMFSCNDQTKKPNNQCP